MLETIGEGTAPAMLPCRTCGVVRERTNVVSILGREKIIWSACKCDEKRDAERNADVRIAESTVSRAADALMAKVVSANPVDTLYARYAANGASLANTKKDANTRAGLALCVKTVEGMQKAPTGLWVNGFGMVGPKGTGKTWLAVALVRDLRAIGIPAMVFKVSDLLAAIQKNWGNDRDEAAFRDLLASCPLLVVDDLGKEPYKKNSWALSTLFDVIDARWNRALPIVVTCNGSIDDILRNKYGGDDVFEAIVDRLQGIFDLQWAEVNGESRRKGIAP